MKTNEILTLVGTLAVGLIVGCGVRTIDSKTSTHPVTGTDGQPCPPVMAPEPGFCQGGVLLEERAQNGCVLGFRCEQTPPGCPQVAAPDGTFCPNGAAHLDEATCQWRCDCPLHMPPECKDGTLEVTKDDFGCITEIKCVQSGSCPQVAAPDATFCPNGAAHLDEATCQWLCHCPDYMPPECKDGTLEVKKDDYGCITDITCVKDDPPCPAIAAPGPDFCPGGTVAQQQNAAGCYDWVCIPADPCPMLAAPDATFCPGGDTLLDKVGCNWVCHSGDKCPTIGTPAACNGELLLESDPQTHCLTSYQCVP